MSAHLLGRLGPNAPDAPREVVLDLRVGDRWVSPGEPIPEAESWPNPGPWVRSEMIAVDSMRFLPK